MLYVCDDVDSLIGAYDDPFTLYVDVQSNRKMLQLLLKRRGFTLIDQCENGKEAVDCVSAKGNDYYDLIFLDNLMPIMVSEGASLLDSSLSSVYCHYHHHHCLSLSSMSNYAL
jgi:CheY-like chemotaxis protein